MTTPNQSTPLPPTTLAQALSVQTAQMFVGQIGLAGFMFAVKTELSTEGKVEVTKHWVQSGAFVNDHTVIPPSKITLRGRVSENETRRNLIIQFLTNVGRGVGVIGSFLPKLTNISKSIKDKATINNQTINAKSLLSGVYTNTFNIYGAVQQVLALLTRQGQIFGFFESLRTSKTIVSVVTPWNFYQSLLITRVRSVSPQASNSWCDMEVDLEEYRSYQLDILTTPFIPQNTTEGLKNSMSSVINKGRTKGTTNPKNISFYKRTFSKTTPA
jgi:hypothetical protein